MQGSSKQVKFNATTSVLTLSFSFFERPTAERLLQHPFFKQARKKDYLMKSILLDLPPLERRPRKGIHRRRLSYTASDEWDFNDNDNGGRSMKKNEDSCPDAINPPTEHRSSKNTLTSGTSTSMADQPNHVGDLPKPRRHISFGHVVVRNPPQPSASLSTSQPIYSPISDEDPSSFTSPSIASRIKKPTSNPIYYPSNDPTRYPIYGGAEVNRKPKMGIQYQCFVTKLGKSHKKAQGRIRAYAYVKIVQQ